MKYLAVLILLTGCSSIDGVISPKKRYNPVEIQNLTVTVVDPVTKLQFDTLLKATEHHLVNWRSYFNRNTVPVDVLITTKDKVDCSSTVLNSGEIYNGCTSFSNGRPEIRVISGDYLELPALFHELIHANKLSYRALNTYDGIDPHHRDLRWPEWNIQNDLSVEQLR